MTICQLEYYICAGVEVCNSTVQEQEVFKNVCAGFSDFFSGLTEMKGRNPTFNIKHCLYIT